MEYLLESFKYGLIPTLIILVYLITTKYLDNKKERELAKKSVKVNAEILDCFNNLNAYLKHITINIIGKEDDKCMAAIRSSFRAMAFSLTKFGVFTLISNNIKKNRDNIVDNIKNSVYAEFSSIYSHLALYSTDKINFASLISEEWKEELVNDMIGIIFDDDANKESKIYNLHNKLNLRITNYISTIKTNYIDINNG